MKKRTALILTGMLSASILGTVPVMADTEDLTGTVTAHRLNVRSGGSTDNQILGVLKEDETVEIVGTADSGWYEIRYDGGTAYASNKYIDVPGDAESQDTASDEEAEETADATSDDGAEESSGYVVDTEDGDLDLLAALIYCEAGGESRQGKVAVGAVVVNRVLSSSYPDSISDVIYQSGQFSPAMSGKVDRIRSQGANADCYEAAEAALQGEDPVEGCLYFNAGSGKGIQIGNQHFY